MQQNEDNSCTSSEKFYKFTTLILIIWFVLSLIIMEQQRQKLVNMRYQQWAQLTLYKECVSNKLHLLVKSNVLHNKNYQVDQQADQADQVDEVDQNKISERVIGLFSIR